MTTAKEQLRSIVDELTEAEAERCLAAIHREVDDSLRRFLKYAPEDDEPTTPEDEEAIERAHQAHARGETIPLSQILAETGRAERSA
jgi:hypothetical protein